MTYTEGPPYGIPSIEEWDVVHEVRFIDDDGPPSPNRHRFGYEASVIKRRAREWLVAMGETDETALYRGAERAYERWASAFPSLRTKQKVWRAYDEARAENDWRNGHAERGGFTLPELLNLQERYAGANDPTSQDILAKVEALLS
jgi:hypothetical protein